MYQLSAVLGHKMAKQKNQGEALGAVKSTTFHRVK